MEDKEAKKKKSNSLKSILGGDILATDFFRRFDEQEPVFLPLLAPASGTFFPIGSPPKNHDTSNLMLKIARAAFRLRRTIFLFP